MTGTNIRPYCSFCFVSGEVFGELCAKCKLLYKNKWVVIRNGHYIKSGRYPKDRVIAKAWKEHKKALNAHYVARGLKIKLAKQKLSTELSSLHG